MHTTKIQVVALRDGWIPKVQQKYGMPRRRLAAGFSNNNNNNNNTAIHLQDALPPVIRCYKLAYKPWKKQLLWLYLP